MYTAIKGIYENGELTLLEPAPDLKKTEVVVLFMEEKPIRKKGITLGSLAGKFSIPDDFNEPLEDLKDYM